MILSVDGYTLKQFNQQFYAANSPYTFVLSEVGSTPYINVLDNLKYYYSPTTLQLNQSIYNFSITTYDSSIPIAWTSVDANGSITTVSGSLSGGTASSIVDLSSFSGQFFVTYSFNYYDVNLDDYQTLYIPVTYFVSDPNVAYNNSFPVTMNNLKDDIGSSGWTSIVAVLIIFTVVVTVMQLSNNMLAGVMTGFGVMIFLAFIGWLSGLFVAMIVLISLFLLYSERGY